MKKYKLNKIVNFIYINKKKLSDYIKMIVMIVTLCMAVTSCNNKTSDGEDMNNTEKKVSDQIEIGEETATENISSEVSSENSVDESEITSENSNSVISDNASNKSNNETNNAKNTTDESLKLTQNRHNILTGTIGSEKVIMDIFIDDNDISIIFVGSDKITEHVLNGTNEDYGILAKNEENSIILILSNMQNNNISGTCYRNGLRELVSLTYDYVTGGEKLKQRYCIGDDNLETEIYVQSIIDAVNNESIDIIAEDTGYPLSVHGKKELIIVNSDQLKKKKIITNKLKTTLSDAFSKFMYSDEKGIRIGNDKYNIWITLTSEKKWVISEINN